MADWDPAKYARDNGILYYHPDGRVEGGLYPPEYYQYPEDLDGGTWEEGLQAIEDFDWGDKPVSDGEGMSWEEGMQEIDDFDWGKKSRAGDRNISEVEAETTEPGSSPKTTLQDIAIRPTPQDHDHRTPTVGAGSTPQLIYDGPEDVRMDEGQVQDSVRDVSNQYAEASIHKQHSPTWTDIRPNEIRDGEGWTETHEHPQSHSEKDATVSAEREEDSAKGTQAMGVAVEEDATRADKTARSRSAVLAKAKEASHPDHVKDAASQYGEENLLQEEVDDKHQPTDDEGVANAPSDTEKALSHDKSALNNEKEALAFMPNVIDAGGETIMTTEEEDTAADTTLQDKSTIIERPDLSSLAGYDTEEADIHAERRVAGVHGHFPEDVGSIATHGVPTGSPSAHQNLPANNSTEDIITDVLSDEVDQPDVHDSVNQPPSHLNESPDSTLLHTLEAEDPKMRRRSIYEELKEAAAARPIEDTPSEPPTINNELDDGTEEDSAHTGLPHDRQQADTIAISAPNASIDHGGSFESHEKHGSPEIISSPNNASPASFDSPPIDHDTPPSNDRNLSNHTVDNPASSVTNADNQGETSLPKREEAGNEAADPSMDVMAAVSDAPHVPQSPPWIPELKSVDTPSAKEAQVEVALNTEVSSVVTDASSVLSDPPPSQTSGDDIESRVTANVLDVNGDKAELMGAKNVSRKMHIAPATASKGPMGGPMGSEDIQKNDTDDIHDEKMLKEGIPTSVDLKDTTELDSTGEGHQAALKEDYDQKMDSDNIRTLRSPPSAAIKTTQDIPEVPHTSVAAAHPLPSTPVSVASPSQAQSTKSSTPKTQHQLKRTRSQAPKNPSSNKMNDEDFILASDSDPGPGKKKGKTSKAANGTMLTGRAKALVASVKKGSAKEARKATGVTKKTAGAKKQSEPAQDEDVNMQDESEDDSKLLASMFLTSGSAPARNSPITEMPKRFKGRKEKQKDEPAEPDFDANEGEPLSFDPPPAHGKGPRNSIASSLAALGKARVAATLQSDAPSTANSKKSTPVQAKDNLPHHRTASVDSSGSHNSIITSRDYMTDKRVTRGDTKTSGKQPNYNVDAVDDDDDEMDDEANNEGDEAEEAAASSTAKTKGKTKAKTLAKTNSKATTSKATPAPKTPAPAKPAAASKAAAESFTIPPPPTPAPKATKPAKPSSTTATPDSTQAKNKYGFSSRKAPKRSAKNKDDATPVSSTDGANDAPVKESLIAKRTRTRKSTGGDVPDTGDDAADAEGAEREQEQDQAAKANPISKRTRKAKDAQEKERAELEKAANVGRKTRGAEKGDGKEVGAGGRKK